MPENFETTSEHEPEQERRRETPIAIQYRIAATVTLVFAVVLGTGFWGVAPIGCYVLTFIVLLTMFLREKMWHERYNRLEATMCEQVNAITLEMTWLKIRAENMVWALVDVNNFLDDCLDRGNLRYAGVWTRPRYDDYYRKNWLRNRAEYGDFPDL